MTVVDSELEALSHDVELMAMFVRNATRLLDEIEQDLPKLEHTSRAGHPALIKKLFRAVHTIKGEADFIGRDQIGWLAHLLEEFFDRVQEGRLAITATHVLAVLDTTCRLRELVQSMEESGSQEPLNTGAPQTDLEVLLNASRADDSCPQRFRQVIAEAGGESRHSLSVSVLQEAGLDQVSGHSRPVEPGRNSVSPDSATPVPSGKVRVLMVDDDPIIIKLALRSLGKAGLPCDTAASAEDALKAMRKNLYNVVICDLNLPGMGGVELIGRLKSISPMVQIIVLTGTANLVTLIESLSAGAFDFFEKVQDFRNLVAPVQEALARAGRWAPLMKSRR